MRRAILQRIGNTVTTCPAQHHARPNCDCARCGAADAHVWRGHFDGRRQVEDDRVLLRRPPHLRRDRIESHAQGNAHRRTAIRRQHRYTIRKRSTAIGRRLLAADCAQYTDGAECIGTLWRTAQRKSSPRAILCDSQRMDGMPVCLSARACACANAYECARARVCTCEWGERGRDIHDAMAHIKCKVELRAGERLRRVLEPHTRLMQLLPAEANRPCRAAHCHSCAMPSCVQSSACNLAAASGRTWSTSVRSSAVPSVAICNRTVGTCGGACGGACSGVPA